MSERTSRRKVVLAGAAGVSVAAAAAIGLNYKKIWARKDLPLPVVSDHPGMVRAEDKVVLRRTLGRTGLSISVVSIGAGGLDGHEPLFRAVDKGMNYIDTSICYGDSERVIARAFSERPSFRDELVLATKWDAGEATSKDEMLKSLDKSLARLGVEKIDVMQLHWLGGGHVRPDTGFNRLDNEALYRAMEEAKKSGKVRFFGATSHDGNRSKILQHAIDKGAFDMILVKMNALDFADAGIPALLAKAKEKNVGVVAMKSQPSGGRVPPGFEASKWSVFQANLRWVLSHPEVTSVCHSGIGVDRDVQDQAASAVREELGVLREEDALLLGQYATALSPTYCRACADSACVAACPDGVAIPHVLQFDMYDRDYGWHARARRHYAALDEGAQWSARCASCRLCTDACPYDVDAASLVRRARARLHEGGAS